MGSEFGGGLEGGTQAKKSQHPSWLSNTWKQCEQCRAFVARVPKVDTLPRTHRNNNHYHSYL